MTPLTLPGIGPNEACELQRAMVVEAFAEIQHDLSAARLSEATCWERLAALVSLAFLAGKTEGVTDLGANVQEMIHRIRRELT
jgi:hypothetical protein